MFTDVPAYSRCHLFFQQDEAPSGYVRLVRDQMNRTFRNNWTGRSSPDSWPPTSPDLSPLIFLLSDVRSLLYDTLVNSEMDFADRIFIAANTIRETLCISEHFCQSVSRWCRAYILANGHDFEHILWCFYVIFFIYYFYYLLCVTKRFTLFCVLWPYCLCVSSSGYAYIHDFLFDYDS